MNKKRYCIFAILYFVCIVYITILSRTPALSHTVRLVPLWSYIDWIKGNWSIGRSILLNVVLFIPFSYLLSGISKKWYFPVFVSLLISVLVEFTQFITYFGYFDVDDFISNFIGGVLGYLLFVLLKKLQKSTPIAVSMVILGLVGCFISSRNTQIYETQFDFDVNSLETKNDYVELNGICEIYNRTGLDYSIQLKSDSGEYTADTIIDGNQFTAKATVPNDTYEINVVFKGYKPISTKVWIKDEKISYVPDAPKPEVSGTDIEFIVNNGVLKVYNPEYDTYLYQVEDKLYWLVGKDFDASLIYHIFTEEVDRLPESRQKYGFDNRSFVRGSDKDLTDDLKCGKYNVYCDLIPKEYNVSAVAVGMNHGKTMLWIEYFRLDNF